MPVAESARSIKNIMFEYAMLRCYVLRCAHYARALYYVLAARDADAAAADIASERR